MTYTAKVQNGALRLPDGVKLPEGTEIQFTIPDADLSAPFAERYAAYIGAADDLPSDLAENLDRYVHGHERK